MNKSDLKQIEELLDKKLEPIKKVQREHSGKLDTLTLDMIDVQKKTDVISDIHDIVKGTRETVQNHEQRLLALETAA